MSDLSAPRTCAEGATDMMTADQKTGQPDRPHQTLICLDCRHTRSACRLGLALVAKLHAAMAAGAALTEGFEISGTACMAGCTRPRTVAFRATAKSTYLFGDIDATADIEALVAFSAQYQRSEDGYFRTAERPDELAKTALARLPAAIAVTEPRQMGLQ